YFFFPLQQGHGWGYRHVHYAFGALPLLAAGVATRRQRPEWRAVVATLALFGLLVGTASRCWEVQRVIGEQRVPAAPRGAIVRLVAPVWEGSRRDWVRNDPLLATPPWTFESQGEELDRALVGALIVAPRPLRDAADVASWTGALARSLP